jgi:hypothetical protein
MSSVYGAVPTFTHGQVLSASGHLNALQDYVQAVHDDFLGLAVPCLAPVDVPRASWTRPYLGILRHKYDTLDYKFQVNSGTLTLMLNGIALTPARGVGTWSAASVDLDALNLTVDQFYEITLSGSGRGTVYLMRETNPRSALALASFDDGTIPTAAEWTALSTGLLWV